MKIHIDKTIKVGSIVKGYYKGYWRVLELIDRTGYYNPSVIPLVYGELVLDSNGDMVAKHKRRHWCLGWSRRVTKELVESMNTDGIELFEQRKQNLLKIVVDSQ